MPTSPRLSRTLAPIAAALALLLALTALAPAASAQTPEASTAPRGGCGAAGFLPVAAGDPGSEGVAVAETDTGITLTMPDGTTHDLPAGELRLEPGMAIVLAADGTRTVFGAATGEIWTFAPVTYRDFQGEINPATAPFVQTGPYIAGPIADDGLDWKIVDTRTGDSVTVTELRGAPLPVAADAYPLPGGDDVAAIRFRQVAEPISGPEATPTVTWVNVGATLVIPGDLASAAFIDLAPEAEIFHDADPMLFPSNMPAVFSADRQQVAWVTGSLDPFGSSHEIHVASIDALDQPQIVATPGVPDARVPVLFTPDGTALLALIDGALTRIDLATGETQPASAPDLTAAGIRLDNPIDGTLIYDSGTPEAPELSLYDAATDTATPLPELSAYPWIFPLEVGRWAGATGGMGDQGTTVLVDTATGALVPLPDDASQDGGGTIAGDFRDGVLVSARVDGTALFQHGPDGTAWVLPLPAGLDAGVTPRVTLSPGGACLLVSTTVPGQAIPTASWVAPLAPDATWTALEAPLLGWWQTAP